MTDGSVSVFLATGDGRFARTLTLGDITPQSVFLIDPAPAYLSPDTPVQLAFFPGDERRLLVLRGKLLHLWATEDARAADVASGYYIVLDQVVLDLPERIAALQKMAVEERHVRQRMVEDAGLDVRATVVEGGLDVRLSFRVGDKVGRPVAVFLPFPVTEAALESAVAPLGGSLAPADAWSSPSSIAPPVGPVPRDVDRTPQVKLSHIIEVANTDDIEEGVEIDFDVDEEEVCVTPVVGMFGSVLGAAPAAAVPPAPPHGLLPTAHDEAPPPVDPAKLPSILDFLSPPAGYEQQTRRVEPAPPPRKSPPMGALPSPPKRPPHDSFYDPRPSWD